MRKRKATVADYDRLRKTGEGLATTDRAAGGPTVKLWPNGQREILVKSHDESRAIQIVIGEGPHGLSVQLHSYHGAPLTIGQGPQTSAECCAYFDTPKAQAFRRWYLHEETAEDIALLGPQYDHKRVS